MADEPDPLPPLAPAPLPPRIAAGVLDRIGLLAVATALFLVPLKLGGMALPMWSVFGAAIIYSIVPAWLFRATPGLRFFGLQLVSREGRSIDLVHAIFREMLGRGVFALGYLATLAVGLAGLASGRAAIHFPVGLGLVLFVCAVSLFGFSLLGGLMALVREDRRGLADLLGRSMVIVRTGPRAAAGPVRGYLVSVAAVAAITVLPPVLLSRPVSSSGSDALAERLARRKLEERFAADPADREVAAQLLLRLDPEAREAVERAHAAAVAERERRREESLRARVAKDPADGEGAGMLITLLLEQDRVADAKEIYRAHVEAARAPSIRAGFGEWLHQHGYFPEAIAELSAALDAGYDSPLARESLGLSLTELGQTAEGKRHLDAAERMQRQPR